MQNSSPNMKILSLIALLLIVAGVAILLNNTVNDMRPKIEEQDGKSKPENSSVEGVSGDTAEVIKVVDGDTIEVQVGEGVAKLRYIGVDTPETVDPRRPVGCFGKEAGNANKKLVEGKEVILQKDVSETDRFGRLLRYVYIRQSNGSAIFVNDYLVRQGYARAATFPPDVKYSEQFRQAEQEARAANLGLWGRCVT